MKIEKLSKGLYHIKFKTQYEATSTFFRLQEFYESPYSEIKGHHVDLELMMDRYAQDTGEFTYFTDWSGFNVPSNTFRGFFKWTHMPTIFEYLHKEYELYRLVTKTVDDIDGDFYIIATYDAEDILHEVAHGLYFLDEEYKNDMDKLIEGYSHKEDFTQGLLNKGYENEFLNDEIQAYLATSDTVELIKCIPSVGKCAIPDEFGETLEKYLKKYKVGYNGSLLQI